MTNIPASLTDVRIRDPFILPDPARHTYYLVRSLRTSESHPYGGVEAFTSANLANWQGPHTVFTVGSDSWGREGVWAPEMHSYRGRYYLFLTLNSSEPLPEGAAQPLTAGAPGWPPLVRRGTQVFVAPGPLGPFRAFENRPHLPASMMTLDGTLWIEDGVPYMVYCHEWVQMQDGTVEAVRLKDDLSAVAGEPLVLFRGSDAPWATVSQTHPGAWVTDGPCLYHTRTGRLLMIWSGFHEGAYTTGVALSESGVLRGPWRQQAEPLFADDGGYGMIFRRFDGGLMLALHRPNRVPDERLRLFALQDAGDTIRIARP